MEREVNRKLCKFTIICTLSFMFCILCTYFDTLSKDFDLQEGCNSVSIKIMEYVPKLKKECNNDQ